MLIYDSSREMEFIYKHVHMYHMYVYMVVYESMWICLWLRRVMHKYPYMHMHVSSIHIPKVKYIYSYIQIHTYIHLYTHIYAQIYTHICIYEN
jgi:hypothetical protein